MTKQEDILGYLSTERMMRYPSIKMTKDMAVWDAGTILKRLSDRGVVIRVDRELPDFLPQRDFFHHTEMSTKNKMLKAGYGATERLI